jgi:tetratricopeptide (TPR) repeat protein
MDPVATRPGPSDSLDALVAKCSMRLRANPGNFRALYIRASAYLRLGQPGAALEDAAAALAAEPGDPDALTLRGQALEASGDDAAALEMYTAALGADGGHAGAAFARASLRNRQGDFHGSIGAWWRR